MLLPKPYDLGQPYFAGMPHFPTHPPFLYGLTKKHGEVKMPNGGSSAADSIALSGHSGTHIDALNHFSCGGMLYGGRQVDEVQSWTGGVDHLASEQIEPIVRRGVLLDIATLLGVAALEPDTVVSPQQLDAACKVDIREGDVVLLRTGWGSLFEDCARYVNGTNCPGPTADSARWFSERKIFAAGADTLAFEKIPNPNMPLHIHFLVESGIHLIENLDLEALARDHVSEFQFVAAPLKIRGGTGAPVRPLAFAYGS